MVLFSSSNWPTFPRIRTCKWYKMVSKYNRSPRLFVAHMNIFIHYQIKGSINGHKGPPIKLIIEPRVINVS